MWQRSAVLPIEIWDAKRFGALCERFELAPKKNVKELSRGMGMKLMLAFALSHDPELLVLDEATAGLDPMARAKRCLISCGIS